MIFSKICFFRKNLHQILSKFEKRYTWLKSNPWPPDQFFMIFWWFPRNLASFRKFRLIFWEIFQICAPVISKSTQQNHLKFLSELSETFFFGTQQTAHELLTQKKKFSLSEKKKNMLFPKINGFLTHLNNIWDISFATKYTNPKMLVITFNTNLTPFLKSNVLQRKTILL